MGRSELGGWLIVGIVVFGLACGGIWFSENYSWKHGQILYVKDRTAKVQTYKYFAEIPEVITVNGPAKIWTTKYPFFVCFDPNTDPNTICADDQYFGFEREAKLTGEVNKGLVYVVKFLDYDRDRFRPARKQTVKEYRTIMLNLP